MFRDRSVVEVMVLVFTFTASITLLMIGAIITLVVLINPDADTSTVSTALLNLISGIIGALLGLLAGKAEGVNAITVRPETRLRSVIPDPESPVLFDITDPPTSSTP